ncbi:MAG: hypothetical protein AAF847_14445 [Bacteroidota bacterium]
MNLTTIARILNQSYNKAELESSFKTLVRIFVNTNYDFLVEQKISKLELNLGKQKAFRKDGLATLCAIPFANKAIFQKFRDSLLDDTKIVLDELIWVEALHQDEIERKFGLKIYTVTTKKLWNNYTRTEVSIKEQFKMFRAVNAAGWYAQKPEYTLSLPPALRRILSQYYDRPESANFLPLESIEKTTYLRDSGEFDVQRELPLLLAYASQGNIKVTSKGRPAATTIGKLQRKLNLVEFFPNTKEKVLKNLRSYLMAGITVTLNQKQMSGEVPELLRNTIFKNNYINRFESSPVILHYLKGMGYVTYDEIRSVELEMFQMLKKMPVGQWVSYDNVDSYMRYNIIELKPINEYAASNKLYYQYQDPTASYYTDKHYIRSGQYHRSIVEPFVKGTFFFFSSFGLVDIAYNESNVETLGQNTFSPYDDLKYVRLTSLGAYVVGTADTYVPPKGAAGLEILLSADSLTMIVDEKDEVADTMLDPYAERISPTRFQTDYRIFLKECRSKKELDGKIKLFQQFISNDLPKNWEDFFNELRRKIDPFDEVKNLRIFKIPTDNDKLIKLVARDAKLKKLVIKAEGYHLLIEKGNMSTFKKRLQEFGYFLTV